jgi:bifunctional ADP-heptose synthase (sugar kinase/adenylyltransferase)
MTLIDGNDALHLPTFARQVFDVTGAGDTAIAAMALANISGMPLANSCVFANVAAGVVVGKVGCVPCSSQELIDYARSLAEEVN